MWQITSVQIARKYIRLKRNFRTIYQKQLILRKASYSSPVSRAGDELRDRPKDMLRTSERINLNELKNWTRVRELDFASSIQCEQPHWNAFKTDWAPAVLVLLQSVKSRRRRAWPVNASCNWVDLLQVSLGQFTLVQFDVLWTNLNCTSGELLHSIVTYYPVRCEHRERKCAENYNKWHNKVICLNCNQHFGNFKP